MTDWTDEEIAAVNTIGRVFGRVIDVTETDTGRDVEVFPDREGWYATIRVFCVVNGRYRLRAGTRSEAEAEAVELELPCGDRP
jgi:hypothetical protein